MPRERKVPLQKSKTSSVETTIDGGESGLVVTKSKKRRVSIAGSGNQNQVNSASSQSNQSDLAPPIPSSTYGDTIVAANPFDDAPRRSTSQPATPTAQGPQSNGPPPSMGPNGQGPSSVPPRPPSQSQSQQQGQQQQQPPQLQQPPQQQQQQQQPQGKSVPMMSGKIYPVELPMIFNPANPNAPPIYPCGICHKEVHDNDQAILCESGCNFWFHRACTGLTEYAFHLLTAEVYAEWVCDKCLQTKKVPLVKFKP